MVLSALGIPVVWSPAVAQCADVLTQRYNNARTGATLDETILNSTNVGSATFGKLWTLYTDGQVVAKPLYVSGLAIDTSGNKHAARQRKVQCRHHCDHAQCTLRV